MPKSASRKKIVVHSTITKLKRRRAVSIRKLDNPLFEQGEGRRQTKRIPSRDIHTCGACNNVRKALNSFFEGKYIPFQDLELGTLGSLTKKSKCFLHHFILRLCRQWLRESGIQTNLKDVVKLEQSYNAKGDSNASKLCINIGQHREHSPAGPELNIIMLNTSVPGKPYGRLIDSQRIDLSTVRRWIECCDSWHAEHCHSLPKQKRHPWPSQLRLIDVQRGCLIRGSEEDQYVTLSYVWGTVNNRAHEFHTTEENLGLYEQDGMLSIDNTENPMPRTVRDAMHLVNMLGQRYLWVDCFCIIQDNPDAVGFQISQMDLIFANAYFTIIASDGENADCGIRGIGNGSQPRQIHQETFEYTPGRHILGLTSNMVEYVKWNKRGWTFQEKLLSQRKLIFSNGIARWMCHCLEWSEDVVAETESITGPKCCENLSAVGAFALNNSPDPMFLEYATLAEDYCSTDLTHEEDILYAFSGITSALNRTFVGGFHYGLPEMFFDLALLWQPRNPNTRRLKSSPEDDCDTSPSWSWVGWKGARGYMYLGFGAGSAREEDEKPSWELKSTVQWYKIDRFGSGKHEICNSWQEYRSSCSDASQSLLKGWIRHKSKRKSGNKPSQYFTHESAPDTPFRFPIPINQSPPAAQSQPQNWSPILFLSTYHTMALSTGSACYAHPIPPTQCLPVSLLDPKHQWAGILYLNIPVSQQAPSSFSVDLIAISAGSAKNGNDESFYFPEWDVEERPKEGALYEFYNVMWVEWKDGIAYRKGIGRVIKHVWDAFKSEWCDVKLG